LAANLPLVVTTYENVGVYHIHVQLPTDGAGALLPATARDVRLAILEHRFDPVLFSQIEWLPLSYAAPDASKLVYVEFIPGDTGSGLVTQVDSFILGTDPDAHTSAPSSGFPSTGACTVEIASSVNGPWIVDATAGTALSTVANGAAKEYTFVNRPMVGLRVTVVITGTQAVIAGVA